MNLATTFNTIKTKAVALFAALNTHTVGGIGLGTGLVSLGAILGQHAIDPHLTFNPTLQWTFDYFAQQVAAPLTATALYAAYLGRPKTIPGDTNEQAPTNQPPTKAGGA